MAAWIRAQAQNGADTLINLTQADTLTVLSIDGDTIRIRYEGQNYRAPLGDLEQIVGKLAGETPGRRRKPDLDRG